MYMNRGTGLLRTGIMAEDFEVLLSTWVLYFGDFVVTQDLEMRLAGYGKVERCRIEHDGRSSGGKGP
jgi:hypothetical protein